jgi:putative transposase
VEQVRDFYEFDNYHSQWQMAWGSTLEGRAPSPTTSGKVSRMEWPKRRKIRLPSDAYSLPGTAWLVSIGTANRTPVFADPIFAGLVASIFETRAEETGVGLDLYCLMPDHAHLLVQIKETGLVDYVRDVKSISTRVWWVEGGSGQLWQRSFHDRGLRTAADFDAAVSYILHNPVKTGLVDDWETYSLIGGTLLHSNEPTHET